MPPFAVLAYALMPAAALIAGGVIAAIRLPAPPLRSLLQHVAAGVVFAAVAGELLPRETHEHHPLPVAIGFAIGVGLMLAIRAVTERGVERKGAGGLLAATAIDFAIDGLLVGIGFAAGETTGILVTVALTLEALFLGLATIPALRKYGMGSGRAIGVVVGLAIALLAGAAVGALALAGVSGAPFLVVLGFGSAALLYLVTEELLVEAHDVPETPLITAAFFVGFLALFVIEMVV